jgi:L-threonylcarbamoyladenylate synthase
MPFLSILQAATLLTNGNVVIFPTETVYGLGANATNAQAVAKIYALKKRPAHNPLIVHVANKEMAEELAIFTPLAHQLAALWPAPLTLVVSLRKPSPIAANVLAGLDSIALRVPAHPAAQNLLNTVQLPIAAPSANISGLLSPTRAEHLALPVPIMAGDAPTVGLESTVVDCRDASGWRLLRPGGIALETLVALAGQPLPAVDEVISPGQLLQHYAPARVRLRLNATHVEAHEALLAFGTPLEGAGYMLNLSETSNVIEAAANLFAMLHQLDNKQFTQVAVMPIPNQGLGAAVNERLGKAAGERD